MFSCLFDFCRSGQKAKFVTSSTTWFSSTVPRTISFTRKCPVTSWSLQLWSLNVLRSEDPWPGELVMNCWVKAWLNSSRSITLRLYTPERRKLLLMRKSCLFGWNKNLVLRTFLCGYFYWLKIKTFSIQRTRRSRSSFLAEECKLPAVAVESLTMYFSTTYCLNGYLYFYLQLDWVFTNMH